MKTIHYLNKIRSHLVTITPMALFSPNSTCTSKLRSALHFRYSIVITGFIARALNPNNHYHHVFHDTFDYNHFTNSDYNYCAK